MSESPDDNLGEWVDLSIDDLASIGQFIINEGGSEGGSVEASFEEVYEEDEEGQQVIQIDVSTPSLPVDSSVIKKLEEKVASLTMENDLLAKASLEQKEQMKEWRDAEQQRYARESELAAEASKLLAEKAEIELNKLKVANMSSEAVNALELSRYKERVETAEAHIAALQHELAGCQNSFKGECELAVEKAVTAERAVFAKELKQSEQLANDLMNEIASLRGELNKSQVKQNHLKRSCSQGDSRLKRELEQCKNALKKSEASYEELLKTLASAKEPENQKKSDFLKGKMSYEDRAILGQACREATRALTLIGDDMTAQDTTQQEGGGGGGGGGGGAAQGGDLSKSVMDVIGTDSVSPSDAAMCVHKLCEALLKANSSKIAIERFNVGEVAMFFPIPKKGEKKKQEYVAFSSKRNKEKHFLADESKELIGKSQHFKEAYVLGRVVHKELLVADESSNHLSLKPGTNYYSVTVSALPFD